MAIYWRGWNRFKHLEIVPGGSIQGLEGHTGMGGGKVFYVNGGSDGNTDNNGDGLTPDTAKQTMKAALALCTSGDDDTIFVLNYGSNARAVEEFPILVTKDMVHIIGAGGGANPASKWATINPLTTDTNESAFLISGQRCEIAGLEIGGDADGTGCGIQIANGVWGTWIHDCWFGIADCAGTNGIYVASGADAPFLRIEKCEFGNQLLGSGILIAGNATKGMIRNNCFYKCPVRAISVTGSAVGIKILNNQIHTASDSSGYGISLAAGTSDCFADGNVVASQKGATSANNQILDASSSNAWGNNFSGIVGDLPA
jgi:hypothetical protein